MRPQHDRPLPSPESPSGRRRLGASDCERIRPEGWAAQPVNALTSLSYVAAAGLLAADLLRDGSRPRAGLTYAGLLGLVGVGSILYHGPQPRGARLLHDLPIPAALLAGAAGPLVALRAGRAPLPGRSRGRDVRLLETSIAAGLAYAGGRTGAPTCHPDGRLQLHGAWHVLSSAALTVLGRMLFLPTGG